MEHSLTMFNDVLFHYIFGSNEGIDCLKSLINAVLQDSGHQPVDSLTIRNPFNYAAFVEGKQSIIDVRAKAGDGRFVNVEVQLSQQGSFTSRVLYYWSRTYGDQLSESQKWSNLNPTVSISFTNFSQFPEEFGIHVTGEIRADKNPDYLITDQLQLHFLNFSRLPIKPDHTILNNMIGSVMYYMVHNQDTENPLIPSIRKKYAEVETMEQRYQSAMSDEQIRIAAEIRDKAQRDYLGHMDFARESGIKEGIKEGEVLGRIVKAQHQLGQLLNKKFGITDEERNIIASCTNEQLLDDAILLVMDAQSKEQVLEELSIK